MAEVVLVHGIGQQGAEPERLLDTWWAAISTGLDDAGLGRAVPLTRENCAMVFYGDLFRDAGAQGGAAQALTTEDELALADQLAREWVQRAAGRAGDDGMRRDGQQALAEIEVIGGVEPMGPMSLVRRATSAAARLRYFAVPTFAVAQRLVNRALVQVTAYLTNREGVRDIVLQRIADHVGPDTKALIGHSLGSVAAYEACHELNSDIMLLATAGSPLGLDTIVYQRTRPQPPAYPPRALRWVNLADPDDVVAATPNLSKRFPAVSGIRGVIDHLVDNRRRWHAADAYLGQPELIYPLAMAVGGEPVGR